MIIPKYWGECRLHHQQKLPKRRRITIKRFGWSNDSQQEADEMAAVRAQQAMEQVLSGQSVWRQERKVAYGGDQGLPIREEVVERQDDGVITRNSYGARCLNTPDVFFADIDSDHALRPGKWSVYVSAAVALMLTIFLITEVLSHTPKTVATIFGLSVCGILFVWPMVQWLIKTLYQSLLRMRGGALGLITRALGEKLRAHPHMHFAIYQTPAGFRVLALHDVIDPSGPLAQELFQGLRADPLYVQMCQRQQCYRARVSGKPWRMDTLRWRGPSWPISDPDILRRRQQWVEQYESIASHFAACRFVMEIGRPHNIDVENSKPLRIQKWHDDLCAALTKKPLA